MGWMDLMKYSKSSLIRINRAGKGKSSSGLVKQNVPLKCKQFRTEINGKFYGISTADEN
jgi:hypothetical protein